MAVKEWEDRIVFLRRVAPGSADKSYGIHVAKLAGLPEAVVARAQQVLANLEAKEFDPEGRPRLAHGEDAGGSQGRSVAAVHARALRRLRSCERSSHRGEPGPSSSPQSCASSIVERLTPLAALNLLASLKERLK